MIDETSNPGHHVRTALVTGGGRGLGRAIAHTLSSAGCHVIVTHRPGGDGAAEAVHASTAAGGTADSLPLDLADVSSFDAFRDALQRRLRDWGTASLDVLVNNGGVGIFRSLDDMTLEDFEESFAINTRGPLFLTRTLADLLPAGASVVNVSTQMTRRADATSLIYSASKAALDSLTVTLAMSLGPRGVRVNSVAPGPTATDFNGGAMRDSDSLREYISTHTAFGRVGRPDDIGRAVAVLVSRDNAWVTGQRIEAAGGAFL
jgi:NAD(P)-dependent dehydrogenase (short-subunit alcohol dehydrogenase family)